MLNFNLRPPVQFRGSGRAPQLNRRHPLFPMGGQLIQAVVAEGAGLRDLLSGTYQTGTVLQGCDENGPYITSVSTTGPVTFTVPATSYNFINYGCIFKLGNNTGAGFQIVYGFGSTGSAQCGIFTSGNNIEFTESGGDIGAVAGQPGHTYLALWRNSVATAGVQKILMLLDMTAGTLVQSYQSSSGNIVVNPINALQYINGSLGTNRLYAGFIAGSLLIPPAVQPQAAFLSIDQIMGGLADPWGLWYG